MTEHTLKNDEFEQCYKDLKNAISNRETEFNLVSTDSNNFLKHYLIMVDLSTLGTRRFIFLKT